MIIEKEKQVKILGEMDNSVDHTFESANRVYDKEGLCPTLPTCGGGNIQPKVIVYDDYNGQIPEKQDVVGAITPTCGNSAFKNGKKIIEVGQISSEGSQCGTVASDKGLAPTITAGTHGYANPHIATQYRIRKLTPRECWRLMGFLDEDFEKAAAVQSNTQLYKEAGNSIAVPVLMAIFLQMNIQGLTAWNDRKTA